jgi:hypothetical protein
MTIVTTTSGRGGGGGGAVTTGGRDGVHAAARSARARSWDRMGAAEDTHGRATRAKR